VHWCHACAVANENSQRSDGAGSSNSTSTNNSHLDEVRQEVEQQHSTSLETENQLLKNEIMSLNREMESAIRRIQSTQEGRLAGRQTTDASF